MELKSAGRLLPALSFSLLFSLLHRERHAVGSLHIVTVEADDDQLNLVVAWLQALHELKLVVDDTVRMGRADSQPLVAELTARDFDLVVGRLILAELGRADDREAGRG